MSRAGRRLWLLALVLYGAAAIADGGTRLAAARRAGNDWRSPANLAVAVAAGLFWPGDIVAGLLLAR